MNNKNPFVIQHRLLSTNNTETREFQAETRKLLDIVTNSIYTDKEVFLRELISNASDALEKYRYKQVTNEVLINTSELPLEINITINKDLKTIVLTDNGIGMSRDELISNLGTIARSGSKSFVEQHGKNDTDIIGQFGVGFYSSFMISDKVVVESVSALDNSDKLCHKWSSDGSGQFMIEDSTSVDLERGSRITMHLKDSCIEYLEIDRIKNIIKKYSSFVNFPIKLNTEVINTVSALWTQDKSTISTEQYNEFYRFISSAYDKPKFINHFKTDAPIDLKCLFFIPTFHTEKFGMVSLISHYIN